MAAHPNVFAEVRGVGLMLGVVCKVTNMRVVSAGYENQVLTVPGGQNVIRVLPSLTITDEEIAEGVHRLDAAATMIEAML